MVPGNRGTAANSGCGKEPGERRLPALHEIGERVTVERPEKGLECLLQRGAQVAHGLDAAPTRLGIEAFHECRRLDTPNHLANADLLGWPRQPQAAAASPHGLHVAGQPELVHDLHQMGFRDPICVGDLLDGRQLLPVHCEMDEDTQAVIRVAGELHESYSEACLNMYPGYIFCDARARTRRDTGEMKASMGAAVARPGESGLRNPADISDEAVIGRVLAGERDIFEIIMRRYNQRLYRVALSIVRNEAEAEDVVQEAYVRAYTHLGQYAGEAKFSTWLTRIAVNEGLRRTRKLQRFDDLQRTAAATPLAVEGPDRRASYREVGRIMESAIEALPAAYRSVVMLRDVEDLSTAEAADCLGIPAATVKTRLHRGHALLRETLGLTLGATRSELFAFGFSRCDRLVRLVLRRIAAEMPVESGATVEDMATDGLSRAAILVTE